MLLSQLEYYLGRDWLDKPFGVYVQEQLQGARFADVWELHAAVESHASVKLTPFGWAVVHSRPAGLYEHAILALDMLDDLQSDMAQRRKDIAFLGRMRTYFVDTLMTEWWDKEGTLNVATSLLEHLPALNSGLASGGIVRKRSEYIGRALQYHHHRAEGYEASILIVLSQIDGLVRDALNVDIFGKGFKISDLLDGARPSPAAIHSFETIRAILTKNVPTTQETGDLSRHGVVHGRELGYDTKINSDKTFVALIAILEWLHVVARSRAG